MKAVIMAGGEGTRLRPQTSNLPKPMLPLVGRPMMEHIVSLLRRHGITDIVVPFSKLVLFLVLAALLGLGAATWPARGAAKLDVLAAIAAD